MPRCGDCAIFVEHRSVDEVDLVTQEAYRDAMARLGAAVHVITTDGPAGRAGFTASAVCSVTDAPPTLLVCQNRTSDSNVIFKQNSVLCVNTLRSGHEELSSLFAGRTSDMDVRFGAADWEPLETGAPALSGATVSFDCRIVQTAEVGTHSVFFCEVDAIRAGTVHEALIYFARAYHLISAA